MELRKRVCYAASLSVVPSARLEIGRALLRNSFVYNWRLVMNQMIDMSLEIAEGLLL